MSKPVKFWQFGCWNNLNDDIGGTKKLLDFLKKRLIIDGPNFLIISGDNYYPGKRTINKDNDSTKKTEKEDGSATKTEKKDDSTTKTEKEDGSATKTEKEDGSVKKKKKNLRRTPTHKKNKLYIRIDCSMVYLIYLKTQK